MRKLPDIATLKAVYSLHKINSLWLAIALILAVFMLPRPFLIEPELTDQGPSWLGIDVSWAIAFNYANTKEWTYGKDVVYTYGPFAFLATRIGFGVSKWIFLLFDFFIITNLAIVFYRFITSVVNKYLGFIILLCTIILIRVFIGVGISWLLLFLTYFWLYQLYEQPSHLKFICASVIICIAFFLKLNSGLIGVMLYVFVLVGLRLLQRISLQLMLLFTALPILLITVLSLILNVHLPGYTAGALSLISGYNETMLLDHEPALKNLNTGVHILFYGFSLFYLVFAVSFCKAKQWVKLAFALTPILYLFLLKKQSTIRCDHQHLHEFYAYVPLILLALPPTVETRKYQKLYINGAMVLSVLTLLIATEQTPFLTAVRNRFSGMDEYVLPFRKANTVDYFNQKNKRLIPQHLLDSVGSKTIDVVPWDSEYILQNKLNYAPRPVFQSFSVYTAYLQKINADAYTKNPPEYILYDVDAIDNRYPINDEVPLHLYILKNYTLCDTFTSNERLRLLLKKKHTATPVTTKEVGDTTRPVTDTLPVGENADFIKIKLTYSVKGKLESIWGRAPKIQLCYETQDGETVCYTTSRSLLEAGIWTGDLIQHVEDVTRIIRQGASRRIKSVRLLLNPSYFQENMHIKALHTDAVTYSSTSESSIEKAAFVTIQPSDFNKESGFMLNNEPVAAIWGGSVNTRPYHFLPGSYSVVITHSGTAADNEFPYIRVNVGKIAADSFYTAAAFTRKSFTVRISEEKHLSLSFDMLNDMEIPERKEDRNAFIKSVVIYKND